MGMHALLSQRLEVLEDALHNGNALVRTLHMNRVGAQIDTHAKRVFHQSEIFVTGPEEGLKGGCNFQSNLQLIWRPPAHFSGNVGPRRPRSAVSGAEM